MGKTDRMSYPGKLFCITSFPLDASFEVGEGHLSQASLLFLLHKRELRYRKKLLFYSCPESLRYNWVMLLYHLNVVWVP